MADSIFTKIINGEIPCHKIYEDDKTLAFLDIHPSQPGHTLVIPKLQIDHVWDLPDEDYQAVMATAKKVALHLRDQLPVKRVGVHIVGLDVPHAHVHLIPFNTTEEYRHVPDMDAEPDHQALAALAEKLAIKEN
jgi:histidine triad (HIT) family protein